MYLKSLMLLSTIIFSTFLFSFSGEAIQGDGLKQSMERGQELYMSYCVSCHMQNGEGIANVFPPLAKSNYLMHDSDRAIKQIIYGVSGEIEVNGVLYNNAMPGFDMTDQEVADVLNYIRNSWENKGEIITAQHVKALR